MGTHPIFESDFDCLTEKKSKMAQMFDEIMQNMEKELIQQRGKVNQAGQQRQIIGRRLEILEQNLAENKVVMMELLTTEKEGQDPKCYKTTAGILVPQTLAGVKEIINKRGQALVGEIQHLQKGFAEVSKRFQEEQKNMNDLVQKAQQIKDALAGMVESTLQKAVLILG